MKSSVKLYLRVRLPDGTYPYLKPAYASNGRIKPHHAIRDGRVIHSPGSTYYLRYPVADKRVWEPVGDDPALALVCLQRKALAMQEAELAVPADSTPTVSAPIPAPQPVVAIWNPAQSMAHRRTTLPAPAPTGNKRLLPDCIATYIAETLEHKSTRTHAAYDLTLRIAAEVIGCEHIEDITREDILAYISALRKRGSAPRTIRNRVDYLQIFLHHFKLPSVLKGNDLPKYTDKKVRAYNPGDLTKMFEEATSDESDLLYFLLCTGAREQETQFACWPDVDLERMTYTVTEHLDLGFRPKDKEEGTLPIPSILVDVLKARRLRYPKARLIFPGKHGGPNGHALRIIKRLALRAGVNCGNCINKQGKSCIEHPVCKHILLHKMRKTFASTLRQNGLPAQTLQRYLRHSDLATTIKYIADQPDEQVRVTMESTFTGFGGVAR